MTHPEDLEWPDALLNTRVRFWMCINRDHQSVTWDGDVATCPDCGVTSEMTKAYGRRVREQVAKELEAVDPAEWALAGQHAGIDAARIARGEGP